MAPPYHHNSAGVRALYELQRHLQGRGYEARITQGGASSPAGSIIVYPETVPGNPLRGETVARLALNYPGKLGGDKKYDEKELIFSYYPQFYPGAPVLTIPIIEDFFHDRQLPRSGGCFWVGKGKDIPRIPETEGLTEITYGWPKERTELARLFNEKEIFYTYDDCTALISEARLCGCKVVVIPGEKPVPSYQEMIGGFQSQLDNFIRFTQEAAARILKISFGCLTNLPSRLDMVLVQSEVEGQVHYIRNPESAAKGLNKLLGIMEDEGADVAVLTHHDMSYRNVWLPQIRAQLALLPESWIVAGIVGKDMEGRICGKFHDTRIPGIFDTSDAHEFPQPASCFDECCIIVNLHKGFRFNEDLSSFDLYGTMCVLQAWEMGGTAWVLDSGAASVIVDTPVGKVAVDFAYAQHHCTRPFTWFPDKAFCENFHWLYERYSGAPIIDSTALGMAKKLESAAA
ncbi:MAG: hypothetical protein WC750_06330 [Patescibacteria group bacterium]